MTFPSDDLNGQAGLLLDDDADNPVVTRDSIWRTKDGRLVAIRDMADSHLLNTIRVLRNRSPIGTIVKTKDHRRRMWLNAMANEAYRRNLHLDALAEGEPVHE